MKTLSVRLSDEDFAAINAAADYSFLSLAAFVRKTLLEYARDRGLLPEQVAERTLAEQAAVAAKAEAQAAKEAAKLATAQKRKAAALEAQQAKALKAREAADARAIEKFKRRNPLPDYDHLHGPNGPVPTIVSRNASGAPAQIIWASRS
jgi:crotonobetainyl-CoA:carnitine CoA-transferase CaiB-like acyl-CoA transferase